MAQSVGSNILTDAKPRFGHWPKIQPLTQKTKAMECCKNIQTPSEKYPDFVVITYAAILDNQESVIIVTKKDFPGCVNQITYEVSTLEYGPNTFIRHRIEGEPISIEEMRAAIAEAHEFTLKIMQP